jgi:hypothetical protein
MHGLFPMYFNGGLIDAFRIKVSIDRENVIVKELPNFLHQIGPPISKSPKLTIPNSR